MGSVSADGYVTIVGRSKDLIITGGYNVYPKEIELAIDEIAGVQESAVVGVPHADFGEAVTAVIVRAADGGVPSERKSSRRSGRGSRTSRCRSSVYFVEELPRNAMGKVQKNLAEGALRERQGPARVTPLAGKDRRGRRAAWCARRGTGAPRVSLRRSARSSRSRGEGLRGDARPPRARALPRSR
jgi:long-subunit acyl-CoA synthetase (AMP-forming)